MIVALASLIVGSAFPMAEFGDPRAFEGRWVVVGPPRIADSMRDFKVEGFPLRVAVSKNVASDVVLVNPNGRVIRVWKEPPTDKTATFVSDWLTGTSLAPDSVAPDPRLVVSVLPSARPRTGWMDSIGFALRVAFPQKARAGSAAKGLLVLFLSSRGPVDALYRDRIISTAARCSANGIDVIGLYPCKDETAVSASTMQLPFATAVDAGNAFADAYRATSTPEVFLLDASLKVLYTGAIDSSSWGGEGAVSYVANAVSALIDNKVPSVRQTLPFGTAIER